jgi:hypothetical protein
MDNLLVSSAKGKREAIEMSTDPTMWGHVQRQNHAIAEVFFIFVQRSKC